MNTMLLSGKRHYFTKASNSFFFIILIVLCIFQNPIEATFDYFSYFDEILALFGFFYLILHHKKIKRKTQKVSLMLFFFLLLGLISSIMNPIQPISIIIFDAFLNIKFFIAIIYGVSLTSHLNSRPIAKTLEIIIVCLAILTALSYVTNIFSAGGYRYGIKVLCLFFTHPSSLASACVTMLGFLFIFEQRNQKLVLFSILLVGMMTLTMRTKAIAAAGVFFFFLISQKKGTKNRISLWQIIFAVFLVVIIGWDQFQYYIVQNDSMARSALLTTSIRIAKDCFPLGAGFGTFGSYFSAVSYSPLYYKYGISGVYGLSTNYTNFISDSFYQMILGTTGVLGFTFYVSILFNILMIFKKKCGDCRYFYAFLFPFIYLIICSIGESAFVNSLAIPIAICMGYAYKLLDRGNYD
ncbi:O-antigen ligase family protein [Anaerosporobacter sp.]|uniref:O-antigen ligase family protein n=1 Tax=Anaerosporobacter sp. TaxID=1872529 RepID=UPI00286F4D5F|nr:hypothetical protein [Anaerosporobacter sp.]